MKSSVNKTQSGVKYPCLMQNNFNQRNVCVVVLFSAEKSGTVVRSTATTYKEGYYSNGWDMERFEPFNGTIELSN